MNGKSQAKRVDINGVSYIVNEDTGELLEILSDKSATGRERPWGKHKRSNQEVESCYNEIADSVAENSAYWEKKGQRLNGCGQYLEFVKMNVNGEMKMKATKIHSCRVRLCPLCSWRRSIRVQSNTQKIMSVLQAENKYSYLMLTLTVPNIKADELNATIDDLFSAFKRFMDYATIRKVVKGWYRGLEITHNVNKHSKSFDTYHPHFHLLLVVNKSYFTSRDYIKQSEWLSLWQKATRNDKITQVDVRKVKPKKTAKNDATGIIGAVCEVAKYSVKSSDYITADRQLSLSAVMTLDKALSNRRLVAYGGLMKEIHKRLRLKEEDEQGDILDNSSDDAGQTEEKLSYFFHTGYREYVKCE